MSTQIKKNGNWVTVAGGTRMWVGTKAALQAALDAGELVDGTAVMVTDDYDDTIETSIISIKDQLTPDGVYIDSIQTAYYKRIGKFVEFSLEFKNIQAFTNIPGKVLFGKDLFSGTANNLFPVPTLERMVAATGHWDAGTARDYFYYSASGTCYVSKQTNNSGMIVHGMYITLEA